MYFSALPRISKDHIIPGSSSVSRNLEPTRGRLRAIKLGYDSSVRREGRVLTHACVCVRELATH